MSDWESLARRLRRAYLRYRRLLAATLAAMAVMLLVRAVSPPAPVLAPVVVASHDVSGGTALTARDVRIAHMPPSLAPEGAFGATSGVIGNTVAGPLRAGEVVTDRRVLGTSLLAGYASGLVAAPVRIQDADVVTLLHAGDTIDVYAASSAQGPATRIASGVPVVMLPRVADTGASGALIVLAVTPDDAAEIAAASATAPLSVTLRR